MKRFSDEDIALAPEEQGLLEDPLSPRMSLPEDVEDLDVPHPFTPVPPMAAATETKSVQEAAPKENQDLLQRYFADQKANRAQLNSAEETAGQNRLYARLGGAFNTIGQGMAGQKVDNTAYDQLAKDAEGPVNRIELQQKIEQGGDKVVSTYLARKMAEEGRDARSAKSLKQSETNARIVAGGRAAGAAATGDRGDRRLHERMHAGVIKKLDSDPALRNQFTQLTNMQNAGAAVEQAVAEGKPITRAQFQEFQQGVIGALGQKGQQSVHERNAKYLDSLGMRGNEAIQVLTGVPQDIGKDNPLYQHVRDLARWESNNVSNQIKENVDTLTEGFGYIYDDPKNSDLKASLQKKIDSISKKAANRRFDSTTTKAPVKEYSASRNQTRITHPDGRQELVAGDKR